MSKQDENQRQTNQSQDGFRQQNQGGQQKQKDMNHSPDQQRQHEQSGNPSRQQNQGGDRHPSQSGQVSKTPISPKDAEEIKKGAAKK